MNSCKRYKLCVTMPYDTPQSRYREMRKEELSAQYTLPEKPSSDGFYHLWVRTPQGRKQIKAKNIENLKEQLYEKSIHRFKDVFEMVLDEKLMYVRDPEKRLSTLNTINRLRQEYKRFFEGTDFEMIPMEDMTSKDIEQICLLNLQKFSLKKKRFMSMRGIIKSISTFAFTSYWTAEDIYTRVDFKKFTYMLVRDTDIEKRAHSNNDIDRIQDYISEKLKKDPNYLPALALRLQIAMGLRRGEIPPLMWEDVKKGYILINKEQLRVRRPEDGRKPYDIIVDHTKTWKDRKFPITDEIREILRDIKVIHDRKHPDSPYLFPAKDGNPISTITVYEFYLRMCKKLDIDTSTDLMKGPHSFRRNAITKTVNNSNGNIIMASKLFGNTPDVAKANYYTGLDLEEARFVLEAK